MSDFINKSSLLRQYLSEGELKIIFFGHDDFNEKQAWKAWRMQEHWTLHCVLRGSGEFFTENGKKIIRAGSAFVTYPDKRMMYYPDENDPWEYVWFTFDGEKAYKTVEMLGVDEENNVCAGDFSGMLGNIENLIDDASDGTDSHLQALSVFYGILHSLTRPLRLGADGAKKMIESGCCLREFSIEKLCRRCGISHAKLCRDFLKKWGMTPVKYSEKCRMDYACRLLKNTTLTVGEIAYSCGYGDGAHFMKSFKKNVGMTCGEYRNNAEKTASEKINSENAD